MPRKGPAPKRPLVNDPVYGSQLVTQLVNKVLLDEAAPLAGVRLDRADRCSGATGHYFFTP